MSSNSFSGPKGRLPSTKQQLNGYVERIQKGDAVAFAKLAECFDGMITKTARSFALPETEFEDLYQEGLIALYRAALHYDGESSSFFTFACVCIRRSMISWFRTYRSKHPDFVSSVSWDVFEPQTAVPETSTETDQALSLHSVDQFLAQHKALLSPLEHRVIVMKMNGLSNPEIALQVNKSVKSVENALYRIRQKLKNRPYD